MKAKQNLSRHSVGFTSILSPHISLVSLHFYTVCLQQILVDCCIRNSWGEKKISHFKKSPLYHILDTKSVLMKSATQKNNPKPHHTAERSRDPAQGTLLRPLQLLPPRAALQQRALSAFPWSYTVGARRYQRLCYTKTSRQKTGKKSLVLFITEHQFTKL